MSAQARLANESRPSMRAVRVVEGRGDFAFDAIPVPRLRPGAARVRVEAAFLPPFFGALPSGGWATPPRPFTPGQCAIGIVEEAADDSALVCGQRVYCNMYIEGPGSRRRTEYGFIGCFGVGPATGRLLAQWPDGTFAETVVLPDRCLVPVPDSIDIEPAILCRAGWFATALAGFERGGFAPGTRLAINGATGLLGTSAAFVALALGAAEVRLFGRRQDTLDQVARTDPRLRADADADEPGLDFVLDCSGGDSVGTTMRLIGALERFGRCVVVGAPQSPFSIDASLLMRKGIGLQGSFWFPDETAERCLAMIGAGTLDLSAFRAETFALADIGEAMTRSVAASGGLRHVALAPGLEATHG